MPVLTLDAALVRTATCPPEKGKLDLYGSTKLLSRR